MTREEYLSYRTRGSVEPMYEYYKEFRNPDKEELDVHKFIVAINFFPYSEECNKVATSYYDAKFNVLHIPLQNKTLFI